MQRLNFLDPDFEYDDADPDGYRAGAARIEPAVGASLLAGRVYLLPPGQSVCPYHYEHGDEEWLLVLSGSPVVRTPDGEEVLEPGDIVCFPTGPEGAHKVSAGEEESRVIMVSTRNLPGVCVYPDSDKVGVFTDDERDNRLMFPREASLDYYDREP
jgi:uncharacterized cupin superfamily protein